MNPEWKRAIRKKRKHAQKHSKDRTPENWELKQNGGIKQQMTGEKR